MVMSKYQWLVATLLVHASLAGCDSSSLPPFVGASGGSHGGVGGRSGSGTGGSSATGGRMGTGGSVPGSGGAGTGGRPGTGGSEMGMGGAGSGGRPGTGGFEMGTGGAQVGTGGAGSGGRMATGTGGAACNDQTRNGTETDVDCGGTRCDACPTQGVCAGGSDCVSKVCISGRCAAPSCTDLVANGAEADVDCGGSCPSKCATGRKCVMASDCQSSLCDGSVCQGGGGPCAGLCANPTVFSAQNYNSGNLGEAATCHQTTTAFSIVACGNFVLPRGLTINGTTQIMCSGQFAALPPPRNGGFCLQTNAGRESYAYFVVAQ